MTLGDIILDAWLPSLQEVLLGVNVNKKTAWGQPQFQRHALKRVDTRLAILQFSMQEVYFMLKVHFVLHLVEYKEKTIQQCFKYYIVTSRYTRKGVYKMNIKQSNIFFLIM